MFRRYTPSQSEFAVAVYESYADILFQILQDGSVYTTAPSVLSTPTGNGTADRTSASSVDVYTEVHPDGGWP